MGDRLCIEIRSDGEIDLEQVAEVVLRAVELGDVAVAVGEDVVRMVRQENGWKVADWLSAVPVVNAEAARQALLMRMELARIGVPF